ncbi:MAG: tetratricopeptide repeat protein [Candidatus Eremiobacteraeota bacterium]|nr:tetratricopeptide repeat protein [Candidatus Eremiobacteraeota bacterium]
MSLARGRALEAEGRYGEAREAYLETLRHNPQNLETLVALGRLLSLTGYASAAKTVLAQAVAWHPGSVDARWHLANVLHDLTEYDAARAAYEEALRISPDDPRLHEGLSYVLTRLGDEPNAERHREAAFRKHALSVNAYTGASTPRKVLLLYAARGGNFYAHDFLDERIFRTYKAVVEYLDPKTPLPDYDVVLNAISDADRSASSLRDASLLLLANRRPVLNHPDAVLRTTRLDVAKRMRKVEGVVTPLAARFEKAALRAGARRTLEAAGLRFPLLLRAPGFHTGEHFLRVEEIEALPEALDRLPGSEVLALSFLDGRSAGTAFRKYRVMTIGGALYPLHLAISSDWKVHYFTSQTAAVPAYRDEEAAFLRDMRAALGAPALRALEGIAREMGLDYGGIDFTIDGSGRVLLFEANATMIVRRVPSDDPRAPFIEAIFEAMRRLLGA